MSDPTHATGNRLQDKVILVTGSTTGIGEAIARVFARQGAYIMIHGRREDAARKIAEELGDRAGYVMGALEDPAVPAELIAATVKRFGRIDGLVNNAARVVRDELDTGTVERFDLIIATNLRAPMLLVKEALPHFRKQGCGRVLNIGSINAYCGESNLLFYSISKGGLVTLTRNLANTYGSEGIQVNHLNVGWTLTPNEYQYKINDGLPPDWPSKLPFEAAPSGRIHTPEEVAMAAIYFLSDEAALINGSILDVEQFPVAGRISTKKGK